jgi:hypothetical protein
MSLTLALWVALVAFGARALPNRATRPVPAPASSAAAQVKPAHRAVPKRCSRPGGRRRAAKRTARHGPCPKPPKTRTPKRSTPASTTPRTQKANPAPQPSPTPPASPSPGPTSNQPPAHSSAWDEPALVDPTVITLSSTNYSLALPQNKDYILQCPNGPINLPWTLSVWGGHNVVIQHCDFEVNDNWVAYLHNTTGTLWVDDVHFGGTNLAGGVQLQEPGATVVMRDVLFDTVYGSYTTNHAELVQTWSGPSRFLIDGLTGATTYQGLFLLPNQWDNTTVETQWDFRNIDIDDSQGAYALWVGDQNGAFPLNLQSVYVVPNPARTWRGWWLWGFNGQDSNTPGQGTWANVIGTAPPDGHFVQAAPGGATGVDDGRSVAALASEQP